MKDASAQPILDSSSGNRLGRAIGLHLSPMGKAGLKTSIRWLILALFGLAFAGIVQAETYPIRPVRIVVPFPPGSTVDILARTIGQSLTAELKQNFIADNRPGAGGNIAGNLVAKSAPDGYTLLIATINLAINPSLYSELSYDPIRDFATISMIGTTTNVLVVNPSFPASSVKELISAAKANPGKFNFGSSGSGTAVHLSGELFNYMAGVKIVHVPYKGPVEALNDIAAGRLDMMFANLATALPFMRSGKLKPLGVTSTERDPLIPELPTIAEQGVAGYEATAWFGILAPSGTPTLIISRLNNLIVSTLKTSEVRSRLGNAGIEPRSSTPSQLAAHLASETAKWARVIKISGAKAD